MRPPQTALPSMLQNGYLLQQPRVRLFSVYVKQQAPRTTVCGSARGLVLLRFIGSFGC